MPYCRFNQAAAWDDTILEVFLEVAANLVGCVSEEILEEACLILSIWMPWICGDYLATESFPGGI